MRVPGRVEKFSALMKFTSASPDTSASASWSEIRESIYPNALESFGKKTHTNKDWFEENLDVLLPLIEVKREAHVEYQRDPSITSLTTLREARKVF